MYRSYSKGEYWWEARGDEIVDHLAGVEPLVYLYSFDSQDGRVQLFSETGVEVYFLEPVIG
ncbi:MAG: hypothetical protein SNG10_03775 [Rikenellaceae bacterium]